MTDCVPTREKSFYAQPAPGPPEGKRQTLMFVEAQLLSHLRLLNVPVGLLINFHVVLLKDGIKRMVNSYREPPEENL